MFLIIKGQLNLSNYFAFMVLSTLVLVAVVIASFMFPFDKNGLAVSMALLSILSVACSIKVMSLLSVQSEDEG
ncbi:hypothetical protein PN836_015205 [Ningiella sp. W23]|uniref:hypothetical protein n=1 Tax=Ningiella sp. W23 TaxID=3023715 RepID=UPI003756B066